MELGSKIIDISRFVRGSRVAEALPPVPIAPVYSYSVNLRLFSVVPE
ncbi:MAG TPA: hypothetical protein VGC76_18170 [Pyrinomonadaceae bacterium]